jgi:phosphopantothenoylcysteine decarboxylase / phosphopantothenate---cysteine ligase
MKSGKTIALCISGSIAAYKAPLVARPLMAAGHRVLPVMTAGAERFIGASTLAGLTGEPVHRDAWDVSHGGELHIELADLADVIAVVPTTADLLSRMAAGRADDLVSSVLLAARCPVLVAPAMHPRMWAHPAVQANVNVLTARGVQFIGPVDGAVASGDTGMGRMSEPAAIVAAIEQQFIPQDLAGVRLLVSAGPTYEDLDPVRFLGNQSSGQMGFALAGAAAARGATVTLVAGPVALETPYQVTRINVRSALDMQHVMNEALPRADVVIMAAAVADYRPQTISTSKLKKSLGSLAVEWVQNPDILRGLVERRTPTQCIVGFALETGNDAEVLAYATEKLARKGCDLLVANAAREALGSSTIRVHLLTREGVAGEAAGDKPRVATTILDAAVTRWQMRQGA